MNISQLLNDIQSETNRIISERSKTVEKNLELFKVLATVKNDLEKTLKKPELLHETVYRCIDLLRANTPYYSTNEGRTKVDPPLSDSDKTLSNGA